MAEATKTEEELDPKFTKGQLEHVKAQKKAGLWTEEGAAAALAIQDQIDAGKAKVIGTSAAVAVLEHGETEPRRIITIRGEVPKLGAALLGPSVRIYPGGSIEDNVSVGASSVVGPKARIKAGSQVGETSIVLGEVGEGSTFGKNLLVQRHATVQNGVSGGDDVKILKGSTVKGGSNLEGHNIVHRGVTVGEGATLEKHSSAQSDIAPGETVETYLDKKAS